MDGGAWEAAVHGIAEGRTRLSNFPFTFHFPALAESFFTTSTTWAEEAMAPNSSTLAWKIPWTEEPGGLQYMGSLRADMTE